ncbi:hypothetical protein PhiBTCVTUL1a_33 [Burkholderia phage phiBtTUL1a]|nr:hypothetical protein PhiBTCVTUL1a_33 [Burkholderia phage phiBtTUL1a]
MRKIPPYGVTCCRKLAATGPPSRRVMMDCTR